jgi:hypothetical protein
MTNGMKQFSAATLTVAFGLTPRRRTALTLNLQAASGSCIGANLRSASQSYNAEEFIARGLCWRDMEIWVTKREG